MRLPVLNIRNLASDLVVLDEDRLVDHHLGHRVARARRHVDGTWGGHSGGTAGALVKRLDKERVGVDDT